MKQFLKKSFMLLLCAAVLLPLLIGMTAVEARAAEGEREYVKISSFSALKKACKEDYPYGASFEYTGSETLKITESITLPDNVCLYAWNQKVSISKGATLTINSYDYGNGFKSLTVNGTFVCNSWLNIWENLEVNGKLKVSRSVDLQSGAEISGMENIEFTQQGYGIGRTVSSFSQLKSAVDAAKKDTSGLFYEVYYDSADTLTIKENLTVPANCSLSLWNATVVVPSGVTFTVEESVYGNTFSCKSLTVKGTFNCKPYMRIEKKLDVQGKLNAGSSISLTGGATLKGQDKIKFTNDWCSISYHYFVETVSAMKDALAVAKEDTSGLRYMVEFYAAKATSLPSMTIPQNVELMLNNVTFTIPAETKVTNKGIIDMNSNVVVKGTLANSGGIYVNYNWNTGKPATLKFSGDGAYSGKGRIYVQKDYADKYTDVLIGLDKDDLEVSENNWSWTIRSIADLKKLSNPKNLTWGKTVDIEWNTKTQQYDRELVKSPGSFVWEMGSVEKGAEYLQFKVCVYKDGKLFHEEYWQFHKSYAEDDVPYYYELTPLNPGSGKYYFTIQAIATTDDYRNSDVVKSDTWTYTKPDTKMKKASNLKWSWPNMEWSGPSGHEYYAYEVYFAKSKTADPELLFVGNSLIEGNKLVFDKETRKYIADYHGKGYLSFRIRTLSNNITSKANASWSDMSDLFYFDGVSSLKTPTVKATNVDSSGKIKLSWSEIKGAEKYQIYRATSKSGSYEKIKTTTSTSFTDSDATAGKKYYYKVRAVSKSGLKSSYSSIVAKTCDLAQPKVEESNVTSTGKIKLEWKKISGAEKYKIYRRVGKSGDYEYLTSTTSTSYTDKSAKAGKVYYYKVMAVDDNTEANSVKSAGVGQTCKLGRPDVSIKLSSGDPKLTWDEVSGAKEYKVYRATSKSGDYKCVKTTTSTSFTDKDVKAGKTYYYKVKAVHSNSDANSAYSSIDYIAAK